MCLGIPGKVVSITNEEDIYRMGKIDFSGVQKEISLAYVPDAQVGDYVIVHAGFAISVVDEEEANQVFEYLKEMNELPNEELLLEESPSHEVH